ncbi:MAG: glycosyltransferase [Terriglobales bacterium]
MLDSVLITLGAFATLAWIYLLLAHGGFWRVKTGVPKVDAAGRVPQVRAVPTVPHLRAAVFGAKVGTTIAAIIPARNEADVVGWCIASLRKQRGGERLSIFLVDDASSDGTADVARKAASTGALTVISGSTLPPGWSGKLWAVKQGIDAARALSPDFFLFTDADIVHEPATLGALVEIAETGPYDLVSFTVKLRCDTLAERFLIPAFVFFFFMLYPPAWIADPRRATAGAAGGCILIRPAALDRAGGIEAIRGEIIDDCALAREVKRSGGRVWLGLTETSRSLRSYGSFAEIGRMIARNAFNQLHHSTLLLIAAIAGLSLVYLAPVVLLFTGSVLPVALGAAAWLLMTIAYLPMVRFHGVNPVFALTLPLAALFHMGATVVSACKYWTGRGGQWKGRAQDVALR